MFKRTSHLLLEYLRINAIRRMFRLVDVRKSEVLGLVALAGLFAAFEGVGLTLLLPILQYAESGSTAITDSSGAIWQAIGDVMKVLRLPVTLPVLLALAFVPILMRQVIYYLNTWYAAIVSGRVSVRMRMGVLNAILGADPEYFRQRTVGELTGVVITQTSLAGIAVIAVMKQLSITFLMLLYVAIMLALSVPLTIATVAFGVLIALIIRSNIARIREFGIEATRVGQAMTTKIVERLGLIRLIKLRGQESLESANIEAHSEVLRENSIKQARLGARIEVTADPLLMLSVFITLYIGISMLGMTLAQLGMMLFIVSRLNAKVKEFNSGQQVISSNMAAILLVQRTEAEAYAADTIHGGSRPFETLREGIDIREVSFEYPADTRDCSEPAGGGQVLHDISVHIPAGSFTAIVGKSGAGKSTLVELLPRLKDPTDGRIEFDGTDARDFDLRSLRRGIGYLTQSAMLFDDTVRANLCYGLEREPSDKDLRDALTQAYAGFVYDLPADLETRLGDRGVRFSGGEQQRLALARVLLAGAPVLILDEPTSALDSESESYIQRALADLHGTKTIIVIAHRLATVRQADQLLVVEDGRIVEAGTHEDLVAHRGVYHRLFESQLLA